MKNYWIWKFAGSVLCSVIAAVTLHAESKMVWKFGPDKINLFGKTQMNGTAVIKFTAEKSSPRFVSKDIIKVNPEAEYHFTIRARSTAPGCRIGFAVLPISSKGISFDPTSVAATDDYGVLAESYDRGAKSIKITGAEKWKLEKRPSTLVFNVKKDGSDLPNINRSGSIKSINADGTVILNAPLRRKYKAGTQVRRHQVIAPEDTLLSLGLNANAVTKRRFRKGVAAKGKVDGKFIYGTDSFKIAVGSNGKEFEIVSITVVEVTPEQKKNKPVIPGKDAKTDLIAQARDGKVKTARLSWWGYKDDVTDLLQDAINSKISKLIIDNIGKPWITEPIFLRSDLEIVFESGAVLEAKRGAYHNTKSSVLRGNGVRNVIVRGEGKGGTIRMWKRDYQDPKKYSKGESRHCLAFYGVKNILVENMNLNSSGGDGLIISSIHKNIPEYVTIRKVSCDDNHRQGISIINGRNILVEDCVLTNTIGTPPQAGIDIETNHNFEPTTNIVVRNCKMVNNKGFAAMLSITRMDTTMSGPVDVLFENCEMVDNFAGDVTLGSRSRWPRNAEERIDGKFICRNLKMVNTKHNHRHRYPIDVEIDNYNTLKVLFENLDITRGPSKNPAIRIANCVPDGNKPGSKFVFKNINFRDVPQDNICTIWDHSFTGDASFITGIPYTPEKIRPITPFAGKVPAPKKFTGLRKYKDIYTIFRPDFWAYGEAGKSGEVTFEFKSMGYRSRTCRATIISPSGKRQDLGLIEPGDIRTLKIDFKETGYHKIEMRNFYERFALKSSTVPAGIYIPDSGAHFLGFGTISFMVPENSSQFGIRAWGRNNILWCGVELYTPDGKKIWDIVTNHAQFNPDAAQLKQAGVWTMRLKHPKRTVGKYHIALPGLPPYAMPEIIK